ncbi:MAG: hypothetical protein AAF141_01260 [Pseudomonadota bacterium]
MFRPQDPARFGEVISQLWAFAIFVTIFRDLHEMATASTINGILSGTFEGNPVTDFALVMGGVALVILLATMVLSSQLVPTAARRLNLGVAPIAIAGMFVVPPNDPDDYLLASVTFLTFIAIFVLSWKWKPSDTKSANVRLNHAA